MGMPIGNLTSQETANLFLDKLDQFIKRTLKVHYYVRYMDDFILLGRKSDLKMWLGAIDYFLTEKLKLQLNDKTMIDKCSRGFEFVGYKMYPGGKMIKRQTVKRTHRFVNAFIAGKVPADSFCRSMASICGHAVHTDNYTFYVRELMRVIRYLLEVQD